MSSVEIPYPSSNFRNEKDLTLSLETLRKYFIKASTEMSPFYGGMNQLKRLILCRNTLVACFEYVEKIDNIVRNKLDEDDFIEKSDYGPYCEELDFDFLTFLPVIHQGQILLIQLNHIIPVLKDKYKDDFILCNNYEKTVVDIPNKTTFNVNLNIMADCVDSLCTEMEKIMSSMDHITRLKIYQDVITKFQNNVRGYITNHSNTDFKYLDDFAKDIAPTVRQGNVIMSDMAYVIFELEKEKTSEKVIPRVSKGEKEFEDSETSSVSMHNDDSKTNESKSVETAEENSDSDETCELTSPKTPESVTNSNSDETSELTLADAPESETNTQSDEKDDLKISLNVRDRSHEKQESRKVYTLFYSVTGNTQLAVAISSEFDVTVTMDSNLLHITKNDMSKVWLVFVKKDISSLVLSPSQYSPSVMFHGLPWKIKFSKHTINDKNYCLSFFLACEGDKSDPFWNFSMKGSLVIIPQKKGVKYFIKRIEHLFNEKNFDWGFRYFIEWDKLMEPENGYIYGDKVVFMATIEPGSLIKQK